MSRIRRKSNYGRKPQQPEFRINEGIRVQEVRLVGDNVEVGVYPIRKALLIARNQQLDLVEISAKASPPVCKIIDYSKFLYEKKRRDKEVKQKTQKTVIKEIRFTPNTDEHDFEFKAAHAERFLKEGSKVKAYVQFKGRSILFKERGELLLLKFVQRLDEFGKLEQMPRLEGKRMFVFLAPKRALANAAKKKQQDLSKQKSSKGPRPESKEKGEEGVEQTKHPAIENLAAEKPTTDKVLADEKAKKPAKETKVVADEKAKKPAKETTKVVADEKAKKPAKETTKVVADEKAKKPLPETKKPPRKDEKS